MIEGIFFPLLPAPLPQKCDGLGFSHRPWVSTPGPHFLPARSVRLRHLSVAPFLNLGDVMVRVEVGQGAMEVGLWLDRNQLLKAGGGGGGLHSCSWQRRTREMEP